MAEPSAEAPTTEITQAQLAELVRGIEAKLAEAKAAKAEAEQARDDAEKARAAEAAAHAATLERLKAAEEDLANVTGEHDQARTDLAAETRAKTAAETAFDREVGAHDATRSELDAARTQLASAQQQIQDDALKISGLEGKNDSLKQANQILTAANLALTGENARLVEQVRREQEARITANGQLAVAGTKNRDLTAQRDEAIGRRDTALADLANRDAELATAQADIGRRDAEIAGLNMTIAGVSAERDRLRTALGKASRAPGLMNRLWHRAAESVFNHPIEWGLGVPGGITGTGLALGSGVGLAGTIASTTLGAVAGLAVAKFMLSSLDKIHKGVPVRKTVVAATLLLASCILADIAITYADKQGWLDAPQETRLGASVVGALKAVGDETANIIDYLDGNNPTTPTFRPFWQNNLPQQKT